MRDALPALGIVSAISRGGFYRVKVGGEREVIARAAGFLVLHKIRLMVGDTVTVETSPYDAKRGRIVRRVTPGHVPRRARS